MGHDDGQHEHQEGHDDHYFEISREDLFKPYKPSAFEKYVFPFFGKMFDVPVTLFKGTRIASYFF